jgi:hypothetical protein
MDTKQLQEAILQMRSKTLALQELSEKKEEKLKDTTDKLAEAEERLLLQAEFHKLCQNLKESKDELKILDSTFKLHIYVHLCF